MLSRRVSDVDPEVVQRLNEGTRQTTVLAEALAVDFAVLLRHVSPRMTDVADTVDATTGITKRMAHVARLILDREGVEAADRLAGHQSDTVRGWAAYVLAAIPELDLPTRLQRVRPLADDDHFAVREWAWLALRDHIVDDPVAAIDALTAWTTESSANLRRFAVESTRPRGVWARRITLLTTQPKLGLPLLEPVRSDPSRYVQDSVANWLNDAAKTQADWVRTTCARWLHDVPSAETQRICRRAQRSLPVIG